MFEWLGIGGISPGSSREFEMFDQTDFDDISAYGIDNSLGSLLGGQGGSPYGGAMWQRGMNAPMPQLNNSMNVLSSLMNMTGRAPKYQAGGVPYANQYVSGLMRV